jgi:peptidoglycan/LPS O-acetylase OafA/YrhL
VLALIIIFMIAAASYYYFEKPILDWRDRKIRMA